MTSELDLPVATISGEAAISALLSLFHRHALLEQQSEQPPLCLSRRICQHLRGMAEREDIPAVLRETCDELHDDWQAYLGHRLEGTA